MQEEEAGKLERERSPAATRRCCSPVRVEDLSESEKSWILYMTAALAQKYLIHVKRQYDNGSLFCSTTQHNQTLSIQ